MIGRSVESRRIWRLLGPPAILLSCLIHIGAGEEPPRPPKSASEIGKEAPAFVLPDLGGKSVKLEDYHDKIVVLNFWAFWCDTWRAELPHLKELANRQDDLDFRLVAISVDGTRLREFLQRTQGKVPFPVLLDGGGKVSSNYHVTHVPTVIILDADHHIRFMASGYPGNPIVLSEVKKLWTRPAGSRTGNNEEGIMHNFPSRKSKLW